MIFVLIILAYLLGSINSAILICKIMGLPSPRTVGSGNPGATNVLRLGSKKAAGLTLTGDVLKGVVPVLLGHALYLPPEILGWIVLAAIVGHIFPVFFRFQGGKGVATAIGALFAISLYLGLAVGASWLAIAVIFRFSSLASIIALALAPLYANVLLNHGVALPLGIMTILVITRHRDNIKRLIKGTETKIGSKKKALPKP